MATEIYTPGYDRTAIDFMRRRTIASHGHFIQPLLKPGMRILDLGCGPGTITLDIASEVRILVLENRVVFAIRLTEQISCRTSVCLRSRNPNATRTRTTTIPNFGIWVKRR